MKIEIDNYSVLDQHHLQAAEIITPHKMNPNNTGCLVAKRSWDVSWANFIKTFVVVVVWLIFGNFGQQHMKRQK